MGLDEDFLTLLMKEEARGEFDINIHDGTMEEVKSCSKTGQGNFT